MTSSATGPALGRAFSLITLFTVFIITMACESPSNPPATPVTTSSTSGAAPASALETQTRRFAPVDLTAPVDTLPANEADALRHITAAARVMDGLFLEQVWAGNPALLTHLAADTSAQGRAELHYFLINKG